MALPRARTRTLVARWSVVVGPSQLFAGIGGIDPAVKPDAPYALLLPWVRKYWAKTLSCMSMDARR